jgi:hypothetical protein
MDNTKTAPAAVARRGMLALIERRHRYTMLYGAHRGYVGYTPAKVASVTRDGVVKAVVLADGRRLQRRDWSFIEVDSRGLVSNVDDVLARLVETEAGRPISWPIEYRDKAQAIVAIKEAAGIAL